MTQPKSNVLRAIEDFQKYLAELPAANEARRREIYEQAAACDQLMIYSYEVADTQSPSWHTLERLVHEVLVLTQDMAKLSFFEAIEKLRGYRA